MVTGTTPQPDFSAELTQLRAEILEGRVKKAETYALYMRNWLALATLVITVTFVFIGVVGIKSFAELENNRKQIQKDADEVHQKATEVQQNANNVREAQEGDCYCSS
jgi:cell division protein FtsB